MLRGRVERALSLQSPRVDGSTLYDSVAFVIESGGKRLRPVLLIMTAAAFDVDEADAMPAALAVELFHNFTLVHTISWTVRTHAVANQPCT